ncbi:SDR family NAD(P)-dependent oxidoreductase [Rhodococcus sp. IEGM 1366]|uniref:SDR family NAD(P)-dependent oxidoreductase n=1 Tax=Rhodococcus sp. IEGM 1366 TaxID=3082223 RepID=UPI0029549DA3|nr:SDR family NAD(P)-dependent oxidoreductase [Rhodococcus sp. IEGM 1366]MDV8070687.1 SDR family NAD(P)-dependent oxidoreductase [Rhodococcus sp. IEGM 1366]
MENFAGKVAVVTGAASGIGRALALNLGEQGMKVIASDVSAEGLEGTAALLRGNSAEFISHLTDVSNADAVDELAERAFEEFGAVHVLCNNAGVSTIGRQWELTLDDWAWVLGADLWGPINGVRSFLPRMLASGQPGHIVNTASMGGLMSGPLVGPYSVAKHGVVGLSKGLRAELHDTNINVSVLCPGEVRTGIVPGIRRRIASTGAELSEDARLTVDYLDASLSASMEPESVARMVSDAIGDDRFWILPNSAHYRPILDTEFDEMVNSLDASFTE